MTRSNEPYGLPKPCPHGNRRHNCQQCSDENMDDE